MSASPTTARINETGISLFGEWSTSHSYLLLAAATLLCLLPFSGRAFHVDDPLFIWSAKQITQHPLDPYGFRLIWDNYSEPMSEVTKNPPLACYYAALVGSIGGWSERALHLGFLIWPLALILGTYRLALRFTRLPLLAAAATLLTPGILVSATSVMCDTMMLALWTWAAILWIEGIEHEKQAYLLTSSILLGLAALTKYFGVCLLPLLLVYTIARKRRFGWWSLYFLIPAGLLGGYQAWTAVKYGHGMFSQAVNFAQSERGINGRVSSAADAIIALSFTGGCAISALALWPFIWKWKKASAAVLFGVFCTICIGREWVGLGHYLPGVREAFRTQWAGSAIQLTVATTTGAVILWLAITELHNWRSPNSIFLALWIIGTYFFAAFANWSLNGRSVMPLIPAAVILLACRFEALPNFSLLNRKIALSLCLAGALSLWVTQADGEWANSAHRAAEFIYQQNQGASHTVWFYGHWGFQYYMQLWGAHPIDVVSSKIDVLDTVVVPQNNAASYPFPPSQAVSSSKLLQLKLAQPLSTMRWRAGAGFYSAFYGPLPFAFGPEQAERYYIFTLAAPLRLQMSTVAGN